MTILFTVGGIAIGGAVVERVLAATGHETLAMLVNIATYVTCGIITLNFVMTGFHAVASAFGLSY